MRLTAAAFALTGVLAIAPALSADPVKIGVVTTLSTPGGYLGEDMRDGFQLAIDLEGGTLGGVPVELIVQDDGLEPERGKQIAERMIESDRVDLLTGIIFSNVAMAVVPGVVRQGTIYISPNAGPSQLAGSGCHENYFNAAWQNDNLHEATGKYVQDQGFNRVYLLAPNYPAGRDALAGFKRYYQGEIADEVYSQLGQTDYAAELAGLRAADPDAVFFFLPGGMGINFVKQYAQAGLNETIPLFGPAFSFDQRLLEAVGDAALGVVNGSQWNWDLDNDANARFVAAFRDQYGRTPTLYASQGYDTANLIGSALRATGGDVSDQAALREALRAADFESVRGGFRFGSNQHPIQDLYVREVVRDEDGGLTNRTIAKVFEDHVDAYASECNL
jgi:branched-chain amino acid transport system substrate-binding protein